MAFNLGVSKPSTGFTLSASTVPTTSTTTQLSFTPAGGAGDLGQAKSLNLFGTPTATTCSTGANFNFGTTTTSSTTGFAFKSPATSTAPQFGLGTTLPAATSTSSTNLSFGFGAPTTSTPAAGFSLGTVTTSSVPPLTFGSLSSATTSTAAPTFSLGGLPAVTGITSAPAPNNLTFSQLEEAINKWTIDLEEQGKVFANQAKHLNAWDRLLMSNGEKILSVSKGIERVKEQQQQLDQDLDFVLAQQKELEDCIAPLEREYQDAPISDVDRDQTYKLAENTDAQLKQMSEDLKEIIEHLNETNKIQELSDPVQQIGRILNAHMNSLQWIDRNTAQISASLNEIAKLHDLNRRNENIHGA